MRLLVFALIHSLNNSMKSEAENQGMKGVTISHVGHVEDGQTGRLLSIRWVVHDADAAIWRCTSAMVAGESCLELWVLP